jgi:hypothetical protein
MNIRLIVSSLAACAALCAMPGTTRAQIFVANFGAGTIGEYTTSGATVNAALISGLNGPFGIAVSGGNLFVTSLNTIGEYTTSGATVNSALVSGLNFFPEGIAVSGGNLFVTVSDVESETSHIGKYTTSGATVNAALISGLPPSFDIAVSGDKLFVVEGNTIAEYTTSGATVNPALVSGLGDGAGGIAVSGGNLFVTNFSFNSQLSTIGEYTTSGTTVNAALVSGLSSAGEIAVSGGNLFVTNFNSFPPNTGTISEYDATTGATINSALVSGLNEPAGIAVVSASVPDPSSTWTLLLLALTAMFGLKPLLRRPA